ncbi:MAG TPA: hypothetical protein VGM56_25400, partial [Byssovorax sp.]
MKLSRRALFAALAAVACRADETSVAARPAAAPGAPSTAPVDAAAPPASISFMQAFPALARALPRTQL